MKKGILILSALCFAFASMMHAQEIENQPQQVEEDSIKGVHPWDLEENEKGIKPEIAHWSIIPRIGFSAFDGDFTSEQKHNVAIPTLGLAVEYNFTPVWSVGVEYLYDMYTVTGKTGEDKNGNKLQNADTLLTGHMHKAGAYVAFDIINLFFPRVEKKIFSMFPYFGAGGAWYKRAKYYNDDRWYDAEKGKWMNDTHARGNTLNYINADGENGPERDKDYRMIGYIQAGLDLDFNLNRTLALGLRANYSYFTRDYVDGRGYHKQSASSYASKNNDGIFDITLNLRFKLEAVKKSHPRNMPSFDMFDKKLAQQAVLPCCHDTVIYYRHDSIIIREQIEKEKAKPAGKNARVYNVYFDNDKSDLRQDALTTIFEASQVMEEDSSLYAVLIGYCDNTASKAHNYVLGEKRAKNVMEELNEEYAIPADHIYNAGMGKIAARKSTKSFGPNRRVSIHLVDKETFELMKMDLQDKNDTKDTDENNPVTIENSKAVRIPKLINPEEAQNDSVETVPLSESARKEKMNEYKERPGDTITVETGMTLAKLARKYYNNTQCWVYIFITNRDQLKSPSELKEGMEIKIPELTEEELKIDTKECLKLYSISAHEKK